MKSDLQWSLVIIKSADETSSGKLYIIWYPNVEERVPQTGTYTKKGY